jgi:hypothetical protein
MTSDVQIARWRIQVAALIRLCVDIGQGRHRGENGGSVLGVTFDRERETKNTVRFEDRAGDDPPAVGTLYMQKSAFVDSVTLRSSECGSSLMPRAT